MEPMTNCNSVIPRKPKKHKKKTTESSNKNVPNPFLKALEQTSTPVNKITLPRPTQILKKLSILGLDSNPNMSIHNIVKYQTLDRYSQKFREIQVFFPSSLEIIKIQQVFNPFLRLSYQLKHQFIYSSVKPTKLFHGTKLKYVHSICTYNFNWRFHGAERGHKIGQGVNFTPKPKFSLNFCDNFDVKVLILADVLVINKVVGHNRMEVPPEGFDTAIREDKITFVKFCDGEFYPSYVIFVRKVKKV